MSGLGEVYQSLGRLDEAEALFIEAVEVAERMLGPEHYETAIHLNMLAELYRAREQFDVGVVPGRFFGAPGHVRIAVSGEAGVLSDGLEALGEALDSLL